MSERLWVGAIHAETTDHLPVTVVEAESFKKEALKYLSEEELVELKMKIAANPKCGTLIPHTGGVRKLRWRANGKGKRGGARVIYLYHSASTPIFLLAFFAKNEKDDLTPEEKVQIRHFVRQLSIAYRRQKLRVVRG